MGTLAMKSPLNGIKILELVRVAPGEFCTMMLADMGADVLKIETPPREPSTPDTAEAARLSRRMASRFVNRNKRSIALDLKQPEAQRVLHQLAADCDVLVEGFRPGVMSRLGGDYETLSQLNPRLIYCSLSGFGQHGPYRTRPGHDINYLALSGVLNLIGQPGQKPAIPLNLVADYAGATLHGVVGILLALLARRHTGRGQVVDIAYLDTTLSLLAATPIMRHYFSDGHAVSRGAGALGGSYPYYTTYKTADGKWLSVACTEPWLWKNFCQAIGRADLERYALKPEHHTRAADSAAVQAKCEVQAMIRQKSRDAWFAFFQDKNVCVSPVYQVEETFQDPQVKARDMIADIEDARYGRIRQTGTAIKLSETPGQIRHLGPSVGEHTDEVLSDLGYDASQRAALRQRGAIA